MRTHLHDLGRLQLIEDGLRLRKVAAPLPAHWSFASTRFKALQLKRKAWGGKEEDGELTKTKKDSNPPANPNDEQQLLLRASNLLRSVSHDSARVLDGKRGEEARGYTFIDLICRVRLGSPEIPD
jgi:hypothetical protein